MIAVLFKVNGWGGKSLMGTSFFLSDTRAGIFKMKTIVRHREKLKRGSSHDETSKKRYFTRPMDA